MSKSRDQVAFELAAIMREAFAESAFKAHGLGLTEAQMLESVVPGCESMVQSICSRVAVR